MSDNDGIHFFQNLGNYFKVDRERAYGTYTQQLRHGQTKEAEGHTYKITVSNTAPVEPIWPLVVFTGVGIAFNPKKWNNSIIMKRSTGYKVYVSNAPQGGAWDKLKEMHRYDKVDAGSFPMLTSDEMQHGYSLYPGQSIVFELNVEPAELEQIRVEGTLSRRHLFHFTREIPA